MTIRRIKVEFVGPDGLPRGEATGSIDRRTELVRQARAELEDFKTEARRDGNPMGNAAYTMSITDAPASTEWKPTS